MAQSLHCNLTSPHLRPPNFGPKTLTYAAVTTTSIHCGSRTRSNRGPLVKGRILSTEAILAVQSLKRAAKNNSPANLSRLIKSDLLAVLRELLRQDQCSLALRVLSAVRSEYPDDSLDLNLYADVINALARNEMLDRVDEVVGEMEEGKIRWGSDKGIVRVVKGVVEAGRRESTVRICRMMMRSGVGDTWTADEYVVKVLSKGLRRFGEVELACVVEREFEGLSKGSLGKLIV